MPEITPELIARLRELDKQDGKRWKIEEHSNPTGAMSDAYAIESISGSEEEDVIEQLGCSCCDVGLMANSRNVFELLVEARNALPALLDDRDRLEAENKKLRERLRKPLCSAVSLSKQPARQPTRKPYKTRTRRVST